MANIEISRDEADLLASSISLKIARAIQGGAKPKDALLVRLYALQAKFMAVSTVLTPDEQRAADINAKQVRPLLNVPGVAHPLHRTGK